jgi:hypothetical protein
MGIAQTWRGRVSRRGGWHYWELRSLGAGDVLVMDPYGGVLG